MPKMSLESLDRQFRPSIVNEGHIGEVRDQKAWVVFSLKKSPERKLRKAESFSFPLNSPAIMGQPENSSFCPTFVYHNTASPNG